MSERATMIHPAIESLLDKVDSKFSLVSLAAKRGRPSRGTHQHAEKKIADPTSPGRRQGSVIDYKSIITKNKPEKSLTEGKRRANGRNHHGIITAKHRGGGNKKLYRVIDFKRNRKDGMAAEVVFYEGKAMSVELPTSVEREITWTEPAVKGDTSGKVLKPAKISTGFEIGVPIFVAQGDKVEIDTRTGEYRRRV